MEALITQHGEQRKRESGRKDKESRRENSPDKPKGERE
jgi:hypothetical protein